MSDTMGPANDPSMDDILASIRKIISDDEARAQGKTAVPSTSPSSEPASPGPAKREDVLLLTELVEEPKEAPSMPSRATPAAPPPPPAPPAAGLVEPAAAGLAASAFERLGRAMQDAAPPPVSPDPGPSVGPNGRTLEDIVKDLLRPMLKEWLDKNLPAIVERSVEREIVRLTRR